MSTVAQGESVLPSSRSLAGELLDLGVRTPERIREAAAVAEREVTALYAERAPELLGYAFLVAHDQDLARDALQETFMRYFVARCAGENIAAPRAWLYRVLHNHVLDRLREAGGRDDCNLEDLPPVIDHRQNIEEGYLRGEVLAIARDTLTRREFECFELRNEGLPYEEIARELNLQCGTVGALLSRAVRKIRTLVTGRMGGAK